MNSGLCTTITISVNYFSFLNILLIERHLKELISLVQGKICLNSRKMRLLIKKSQDINDITNYSVTVGTKCCGTLNLR